MRTFALAAFAALLAACTDTEPCTIAPACDQNRSINCDYLCAGCSGVGEFRDCGADTCEVVPGDRQTVRFYRDRAVCVVQGTDFCDPALAPPPTCDGLGAVQGCSAYHRVITTSCRIADRYFARADCCSQAWDGGSDGGSDGGADAGLPDGGP